MSRYLPSELKYIILQYLSIPRLAKFSLPKSFWVSRVAAEADVSTDAVLNIINNQVMEFNLTRFAGYFNIIVPNHAEIYFCPVQCYLYFLDNPNYLLRQRYLELSLPYLRNGGYLDLVLNIIGNKSLQYPWLTENIIYIYKNINSIYDLSFLAYAYANATSIQREIIDEIASNYRRTNYYETYLMLKSIVTRTWSGTTKRFLDKEVIKIATQFGYADILTDTFNTSIVEGYLLAGNIVMAITHLERLRKYFLDDVSNYEMFAYIDSLDFYLALEKIVLSSTADPVTFYLQTLTYAMSIVRNNGIQTKGRIFHYALNKVNLLNKRVVATVVQLLTYKSIFDFAGFYQSWNIVRTDLTLTKEIDLAMITSRLVSPETAVLMKSTRYK